MKTRILAASVLLATTAACSSNSGTTTPTPTLSANDQAAIHSLSDRFMAEKGSLTVDETQANCVARGLVTQLGTEKLQKYNLLDANLEAKAALGDNPIAEADAEVVADVVFGCVSTKAMFQAIQEGESTIPRKTVRCLRKKLDDAAIKKLFVIVLTQDQNVSDWGSEIIKPLTECLSSS